MRPTARARWRSRVVRSGRLTPDTATPNRAARFASPNALAFVRHREAALDLARRAQGREDDTWRQALFSNALPTTS